MRENPLSKKHDGVCSCFVDDAMKCKHGHQQTSACTPYISPFSGEWMPKRGPVCVVGNKHEENRFHRTGV